MADQGTGTETPTPQPATTPWSGPESWMDAAQSAQPGDAAQAALKQAQNPDRSSVQTTSPTVTANVGQPVPVMLRPKRAGLLGVVDKIADALTGTTRPEIYTDDQGNEFVYHPNLSRGQQWARIGSEMFHGAAAGLAAGRGKGPGAAALAGFEGGQQQQQQQRQQEKEMNEQAQKDMMAKANLQMVHMQQIEQAWRIKRLDVEAQHEDFDFAQKQIKFYTDQGGQVLGTAAHPGDIGAVLNMNPTLAQDFVKRGVIVPISTPTPDGHEGVTFIKMPDDFNKRVLPPGTEFHTWDPVNHALVAHKASDGMTGLEWSTYESAAGAARDKFNADQAENKLKGAQAKNLEGEQTAREKELPSKIAENQAHAAEANARAKQIREGMLTADGQQNPIFEAMANALYDGDLLPKDLKREAKDAKLDPNALVGRAIQIGKEKGKPWSETIIEQENKFAGSEKTQAALDGIDRVIDPATGYMKQMLTLAKQADLGTHGWYNNIELAARRWGGETTAKNLQTGISELRRSIAGLIGNPLLGGGETDKKLEQAEELLGKSPTMENLQSAADILTNALQTQKQSIIGNNRFLQRRYGGQQPTGQPAAAAPAPAAPPAAAAPAQPAAQPQIPPRPPNVPAGAQWHQEANGGKGAWTL